MTSKKSPESRRQAFWNSQSNSQSNAQSYVKSRPGERSFSLVETVVAVALIAFLMIEVSGVHGNAINFADYSRKSLQATYLAKRLMSQVEYQASWRTPLKDIAASEKDRTFEDAPDFQYSLTIEPLPNALDLMFKVMSGGLVGGNKDGGDDKSGIGAMLDQVKTMVQAAVGDDPIWVANVSVSWAEGARRSSVELAMIIADTKKLEATITPLLAKAPRPSAPNQSSGALPQNSLPPPAPPPAPPG